MWGLKGVLLCCIFIMQGCCTVDMVGELDRSFIFCSPENDNCGHAYLDSSGAALKATN
jgi:hypothetical protein